MHIEHTPSRHAASIRARPTKAVSAFYDSGSVVDDGGVRLGIAA
jgi:hypothetical protein